MVGLNDLMENDVVLKRRDDFTKITNQATVDREPTIGESGFETLNSLEDETKRFVNCSARHIR